MRYRSLLVVALVATFHLSLLSVQAAKPRASQQQAGKKHKHHPSISGTVVAVHHNKEKKGHGTIKVHTHHKKQGQNNQAQAKVAKNAAGQQKKQTHTVKIHFGPHTKFAHVFKGMVPGKPQVKAVGKGKSRSSVVIPGKPKMATQKTPAHLKDVHKGQHVHIKLSTQQHHHAAEVHLLPTKTQAKQQANKP